MAANVMPGTLGAVLYNSKIISEQDILDALEGQKRYNCRFGEALIRLGLVTQEDIGWALSNQLDIPYIRLNQNMIDMETLKLLSAVVCRKYNMIPLIKADDELSIAISDPLDKEAIAVAEKTSGCRINPSVALMHEITGMLDACYGLPREEYLGFVSEQPADDELAWINADCSGQRLLDWLLESSIKQQWSSFSFEPLGEAVSISFRKGGRNYEAGRINSPNYIAVSSLIRRLASLDCDTEASSSGIIRFRYHHAEFHFMTLILRGESGDYITFRRHFHTHIPLGASELRLSDFQKGQLHNLLSVRHGLVIFASRSPHERCSFMDMLLEEMDTSGLSVLIIGSRPGRMKKIFPRIPMPDNKSAKGRLIMDSLEHSPDILVIEDGTALEPFAAAARAAMRGKLVLLGVDIRGTGNLFEYLIRYRQRNAFLTHFLAGVVSFKGIQLLCQNCRQTCELPDEELAGIHLSPPPELFYNSSGCEQCDFTGISERIFLTDIIPFNREMHSALDIAHDGDAFVNWLHSRGYEGIEVEGEALIRAGAVSPEEYIAAVVQ